MKLWAGLWRDLVLNGLIAWPVVPNRARFLLLQLYGLDVQPCNVSSGVWFGSRRVRIGCGTFINRGCLFNTPAPVTLGEKVNVAMGVMFITGSHELAPMPRRAGEQTSAPIQVGDGAWIGARVTVLGGVTIGSGAVIAAGAVVTEDCKPDALYAGVPARWVRNL